MIDDTTDTTPAGTVAYDKHSPFRSLRDEVKALRVERDRYARALRRVVMGWMDREHALIAEFGGRGEDDKLRAHIEHLKAREARGPWRETWVKP